MQLKTNNGRLKALSGWFDRSIFARALGVQFHGRRDLYEAFGWDRSITSVQLVEMYKRGGISYRLVHAYPDATWSRPPKLYIEGDDAWNAAWAQLVANTDLWDAMKRLDVMADLGSFAILIIGTDKAKLDTPLRDASEITFLQPYGDVNVTISRWNIDPTDPNFGTPQSYLVQPNRLIQTNTTSYPSVQPLMSSFTVDASRVVHINHGGLENKVFGMPRYVPIWNYLMDLMKVVGGSSESYWMNSYRGMQANITDPEVDMNAEDEAALADELDEYQHGLRRFIRTRGVDIKEFESRIADPSKPVAVLMDLIAGASGIPQKVLMGSEAGQLASSQDRANWAERVEEYRATHAEPRVLRPFLKWLNAYGILPTDVSKVQFMWPDAYRMSPLERGQTSAQTARTLANLSKGLQPIPTIPAVAPVMDFEGKVIVPGTPAEYAEPLITRDEARTIIGLSTDQNALNQIPTSPIV